MKKRNLLYAALILAITVTLNSCFHDHFISIHVNDDDNVYRMRASYNEDLSGEVQRVINKHLRKQHFHTFVSGFADKEITLDDGTVVYIKARPGSLRIKIDKAGDAGRGYLGVKEMCEEVKDVLANRNE